MDEILAAATRLLAALGGPQAIIERRHLSSDDDVDAIARAVELDARVMRVPTTAETARALAFQLRLRELAPSSSARLTLDQLVERALACPVEWTDAVLERVTELRGQVGDLAATVELARAIDPHGDYTMRRLRRCA